jgi:hypothetical protein
MKEGTTTQGGEGDKKHFVVSYEANKVDMMRLKKAYTGIVINPGMPYNIQNAFHSQG